jgi:hypothetical protein
MGENSFEHIFCAGRWRQRTEFGGQGHLILGTHFSWEIIQEKNE